VPLQVLKTIAAQAWSVTPHTRLSHQQLVTLLFSSAQLAAWPPAAAAASDQPATNAAVNTATGGMAATATAASASATAAATAASSNAAATATPTQGSAVKAVADELILATMPEHEQQQQQQRLDLSSLIRVLWSLCVYGGLDISQYGWLLVAVAAGPWQRLGEEQMLVIKQGQVCVLAEGSVLQGSGVG
jgi:hypothetical protein